MALMDDARTQIMDPKSDVQRIADWTNLITCGYECGGKNQRTIEQNCLQIIENVEAFYSTLSDAEIEALPDGVNTRLRMAYDEAKQMVEKQKANAAIMAGSMLSCVACGSCCESCGICAEPD